MAQFLEAVDSLAAEDGARREQHIGAIAVDRLCQHHSRRQVLGAHLVHARSDLVTPVRHMDHRPSGRGAAIGDGPGLGGHR